MIAKLTGRMDWLGEAAFIVDVGGVGYLVHASARTLRGLPSVGGQVAVAIETVVREDAITLYGFLDVAERDWFRLLQTVQGVGAKVALALLSALSTDELARAILGQDKTAISRAQGVGPKLATRLLHELKDKAGSLAKFVTLSPGEAAPAATAAEAGPVADAVSALENLGYRRPEAIEAVAKARRALGENAGASDLIRGALREIAS